MTCMADRPDFYPGKYSDSEYANPGEWLRLQSRAAVALEAIGGTLFVVLVIAAIAAFLLLQVRVHLPLLP